jgi:protein arginine N-methyltransferase 3
MSVRLPPRSTLPGEDSDSEEGTASSVEDNDEEETWDDWVSDSMEHRPCRSLFEDKVLPSVEEALAYDKGTHGLDLDALCGRLCGLIRSSGEFSFMTSRSARHL